MNLAYFWLEKVYLVIVYLVCTITHFFNSFVADLIDISTVYTWIIKVKKNVT